MTIALTLFIIALLTITLSLRQIQRIKQFYKQLPPPVIVPAKKIYHKKPTQKTYTPHHPSPTQQQQQKT